MGLGSFISNAVKSAGKLVAPVTRPIGKALEPITKPIEKGIVNPVAKAIVNPITKEVEKALDTIQKVPVLGQVFNIYTGKHFFDGADRILKGERIDRAALKSLKGQMREYTSLAPYAASVVSFVPGVGPGIGGAIAAAGALAEGRPLSAVALAAIKGAIPGGAIAQAAFNFAEAAAAGKPIDQIAVATLPIDNKSKQALTAAIALTKDLAKGKRLDKALMNRIDDAMKLLPPELAKAVNVGNAVGIAQRMQKDISKSIGPDALSALSKLGQAAALKDKVISTARANKNPLFQQGFDVASGLLNGKNVNQAVINSVRNKLKPEQKKGFDAAAALQIGRVKTYTIKTMGKKIKSKGPITLKKKVGFYTTIGIAGAKQSQKTGIVKEIAKDQEMRNGAVDAIKHVAVARDKRTIWDIIKSIFGFGAKPKQLQANNG